MPAARERLRPRVRLELDGRTGIPRLTAALRRGRQSNLGALLPPRLLPLPTARPRLVPLPPAVPRAGAVATAASRRRRRGVLAPLRLTAAPVFLPRPRVGAPGGLLGHARARFVTSKPPLPQVVAGLQPLKRRRRHRRGRWVTHRLCHRGGPLERGSSSLAAVHGIVGRGRPAVFFELCLAATPLDVRHRGAGRGLGQGGRALARATGRHRASCEPRRLRVMHVEDVPAKGTAGAAAAGPRR